MWASIEAAHHPVDAAEDEETTEVEAEAVYIQRDAEGVHARWHCGGLDNGLFRFVEVFVDRYAEMAQSTAVELIDGELVLKGLMALQGYEPFGVVAYRDPLSES